MTNIITVKVIRVPGSVSEVGLEAGATISDALSAANVVVESHESMQLNGNVVDGSTVLSDGDRVIVSKAAKGNS